MYLFNAWEYDIYGVIIIAVFLEKVCIDIQVGSHPSYLNLHKKIE